MTLIALTSNFSYPIIIGDILMTSTSPDNELKIPLFLSDVKEFLPENQRLFPAGLRQKVYVVVDNIAIALAGNEFEMKLFLDDIKNNFKYREPTIENLNKYLSEFDFDQVKNSSGLIVIAEKKEEGILIDPRTFGRWNGGTSPNCEHILACGSGSEYFIKEASQEMFFHNPQDNKFDLHRAISYNYVLICMLLGQERLTLETIKKYWGAGFEMIYFDGNKFQKNNDITYVLWRGKLDLDTEKYEMQPFVFMNMRYCKDILVVSVNNGTKTAGFGVLPLDKSKDDVDDSVFPEKFDFSSNKICLSYVIELSNGKIITPSLYWEMDLPIKDIIMGNDEDGNGAFFNANGERVDPPLVYLFYDEAERLGIMVQSAAVDFLMQHLRHAVINNTIS